MQHFMGCQVCNELNRNGDLQSCREGMQHSYDFTARYQAPMLAGARPRSEADKSQLRELPYCSNNPSEHGCRGAKPLDAERQAQLERVGIFGSTGDGGRCSRGVHHICQPCGPAFLKSLHAKELRFLRGPRSNRCTAFSRITRLSCWE